MIDLSQDITLIHGDCLEVMKEIPDKSIDLVLTDPPYGIGIDSAMYANAGTQYGKSAAQKKDYGDTSWDNSKLDKKYFDEAIRVSKNQVIFGGNYYTDLLPPSRCWFIWDKKTDDKYSNDFADAEMAWCSIDRNTRIIRYLWHGMIQSNMKEKEVRYHPTQKPVNVMKRILNELGGGLFTVLDPFMGSGTTGVACKELGRKFIGIEIHKPYFDIAERRINNAVREMF